MYVMKNKRECQPGASSTLRGQQRWNRGKQRLCGPEESIINRCLKYLLLYCILLPVFCSLGYRSNNFIVGLTNTDPEDHAPVLWNYTLCGQYPGNVPDGATVTVQCTNAYEHGLHFRYVIVQFPLINDWMNFCETEVFIVGKPIIINMKTAHIKVRSKLSKIKM